MKTILRYPGSKWNLAKRIVDLFPEHKSYLEPYFGSGAVLFTKELSSIETVNDLNDDVVNLFRVIQATPKELSEKLFLTPYSRTVYNRAWETNPHNEVDKAAIRLKQVQIENRPALDLISEYNRENVCMYIDPPYVLSTRTRKQYTVEMEDQDHQELLEILNQSKAKILLSGYDSKLYNKQLHNWERVEFAATAEHGLPRTEILWMNFQPKKQLELF